MISLPGVMVEFSLGSSPSIDSEVTDLPLPDSPTRATVAFLGMSKLMPFTASKLVFLSRRKLTRRFLTERRVSIIFVVRPLCHSDDRRRGAGRGPSPTAMTSYHLDPGPRYA